MQEHLRHPDEYGCALRRDRGDLACGNSITLKAEVVDETVLRALRSLIEPDVLAEAVERALGVLASGADDYAERRTALTVKVAEAESRTARLVAARAAGGAAFEAVKAGLEAEEETKAALRTEVEKMPPVPPTLDTDAILAKLKDHAADVVGLLSAEHGPRTRALLRKLMPEPLTADPVEKDGRKGYRLTGRVCLLGLIDGQVADLLSQSHSVPTGGGPNGKRTQD
jgi:hypothetical protein